MVRKRRPVRHRDVTKRTSKTRARRRIMTSCGNERTPARRGEVKSTSLNNTR